MNRPRRWSALTLLFVPAALLFSAARGQTPPAEKGAGAQPESKWLVDRAVTVTAAPPPVPALKYRLFPSQAERKEGNAVPIYLRVAHERSDAWKKIIREKPSEWNKLPLDKLPLDEVKKFLSNYRYNLRQFELGARRKTAEWNYTLDAGNPIGLLLPDMQEMRMHAPILVLKARVEIVEGRYADAIRTLETGFAFSRHIAEAPFLISSLVAIAMADQFADCALELAGRPDAPSLYWALTVIPRPLVDLRKSNEFEQTLMELQFPDLGDLDRPRPPEEWDAALKRMREEAEGLMKGDKNIKLPKPGSAATDPASKSPDLAEARKYLAEVVGMKAARIDAMSPAEMLLRAIFHSHREMRDEVFKTSYLPFVQGRHLLAEAHKRLKALPDTEVTLLSRLFLPAIQKVRLAEVRIDRRLALLRTIEALRMHAAANGGKLPDKLDEVTVAPVPIDLGTGRPFEYQREGQTATLTSRIPGERLEVAGMRYRVTLRNPRP
jgi:hypothetical protein